MGTRNVKLTVILESLMREDDIKDLRFAISMFHGVLSVEQSAETGAKAMTEDQATWISCFRRQEAELIEHAQEMLKRTKP